MTAPRRLALLLLLLGAGLPAPGWAVTPVDVVHDLWSRLQGDGDADDQLPKPAPHAIAGGAGAPAVSLGDLRHPITLERDLRAALNGPEAGWRLTVPGGQARAGDFSIGSEQTTEGDLLVVRGTADVYGRLRGNLVALDGDVVLHHGALVTGDVLALGGQVHEQGGEVGGEIRSLSAALRAGAPAAARLPLGARVARAVAGVGGVALSLLLVGFGLVLFGRGPLEVTADTVANSFTRSLVAGLLGQVLVIPTFGMLVVGLILTVAGILLIPFVVVVFALLLVVGLVGGTLAVLHAMGETISRRQMAKGARVSPNGYRYVAVGLAGPVALWLVWALVGWVPLAGDLVRGAAILVTWLLATLGFGAALLSRGGFREQFAGRIVPPEMLTDEFLWATPRFGVPSVKRPGSPGDSTPPSGSRPTQDR